MEFLLKPFSCLKQVLWPYAIWENQQQLNIQRFKKMFCEGVVCTVTSTIPSTSCKGKKTI